MLKCGAQLAPIQEYQCHTMLTKLQKFIIIIIIIANNNVHEQCTKSRLRPINQSINHSFNVKKSTRTGSPQTVCEIS